MFSKYQTAIFDWMQNGSGHAVVMARAGSGKTFTIEHALDYVEPCESVLFLAFNKHIADELRGRLTGKPCVEVATLNSFGWRVCRSNVRGVKLAARKTSFAIKEVIEDWKERRQVQGCYSRLVGLRKATLCPDWSQLSQKYDVDMPDRFDLDELNEVWDIVTSDLARMDFDDQIYMPIANGWAVPQYDWVFVDEAQDLSPCQIELVSQAGRRIVAVGDDRQAIYGFRGADPDAIDRIIERLEDVTVLPLNVCYRCPSAVLDEARKIVPDIEDAPNCVQGSVAWVKKLEATSGDYVLCRTTAPLVGACLKMIASGQKAIVKGRDLGIGLVKLIEKCDTSNGSIPDMLEALDVWWQQEGDRWRRQERDTSPLDDKVACIELLSVGCSTVGEIGDKIYSIFSDTLTGVVFCTVHRAKGLQAERIWILRPELMPFPKAKSPWQLKQEMNLKYVAITRAQSELRFVKP